MPYSVENIDEMIASVDRLGKATVSLFTAGNEPDNASAQQVYFQLIKEQLGKVKIILASEGNEASKERAGVLAQNIQAELNTKIASNELLPKIAIPTQMKESEKAIATQYNEALDAYKALDTRLTDSQFEDMLSTIAASKARAAPDNPDDEAGNVSVSSSPTSDPLKALKDSVHVMETEALAIIMAMDTKIGRLSIEGAEGNARYKASTAKGPLFTVTAAEVQGVFEGAKKILNDPKASEAERTGACKVLKAYIEQLKPKINRALPDLGMGSAISSSSSCGKYHASVGKFDAAAKEAGIDLTAPKVSMTVPVPMTAAKPVAGEKMGWFGKIFKKE
jgi:hypothetical protein